MSCGPFALQHSRGRFFAIHLLLITLWNNPLHQVQTNRLSRELSISLFFV